MLLTYAFGLVGMFALFTVLSFVGKINEASFQNVKPSKLLIFVFLFLISLISSFQFTSFPFSSTFFETDQTVFQYIGMRMHEGLVPYNDLFDHKGIILYFIQYISLIIPQHTIGLWLVELINIFIFSVYIYKIAGMNSSSYIVRFLTVISVICISSRYIFDGGNLSETYAMTWITIALYYFLYFIENNTFKNYSIILIGISFSIVFFLRQNMIGVWMFFIPCVIVLMLKDKDFSGLLRCIFLFLVGCGIVMIPLLLYFLKTDSLKSMIEYYFIFNFAYSGSTTTSDRLYAAFVLLFCAGLALPSFVLSAFYKEKKKTYFYNFAFFVISLILSSLSALTYSHYAMMFLPAIIIPIVYSVKFLFNLIDKIFGKKVKLKKNIAVVLSSLLVVVIAVYALSVSHLALQKELPETVNYINENTEKTDDVLVIGNECYNYFYTGRKTKNKFFYQMPPINISEKLAYEFLNEVKTKPSDFIIAFGDRKAGLESDSVESEVYRYLEKQCDIGKYVAEDHDDFFVYKKIK